MLYEHLDNCRELLEVHKTGSTNAQLEDYLFCIGEKLKIDFGLSIKVSRPLLRKKMSVDEVINQIKQYSEMPDTAVLIGLEGKYGLLPVIFSLVKFQNQQPTNQQLP